MIALVGAGKSRTFLALFFLSAFAQTILLTVLPVEALRLFGSARELSLVYVLVGMCGIAGRLAIPSLTHRFGRPRILALGAGVLWLSCALLASDGGIALVFGLALNVFAIACFEIVLNIYVLDHVARSELGRFESNRIFVAAAPWTLGPWLGVYLQLHVAFWLPFVLSGVAGLALLGFFHLRRRDIRASEARTNRPLAPLHYIGHFMAQRRLRLAWTLALGRSAWWSMFQIYAPVFAVKTGLGAELGGLIVSVGVGWMWLVLFWGWLGRRWGIRRLLLLGYLGTGSITIATALLMRVPALGAAMLVASAFVAEMIDGAGNSLYLRAVHRHEAGEMTAVFVTYRDVGQLAPPALFSALLTVFELPAVFLVGGIMMLAMAGITLRIPRRF